MKTKLGVGPTSQHFRSAGGLGSTRLEPLRTKAVANECSMFIRELARSVRLRTDIARHVSHSVLLSRRWPRLKFCGKVAQTRGDYRAAVVLDHAAPDFPFVQHGW